MLRKIFGTISVGIPAVLSTIMALAWWNAYGTHEVYPYLMTVIAILLWSCTYLTVKEKED